MDRIEAMEVFLAVVDQGGFAAAARQLGHSPAAVTRAVAYLEAHLNTRLFHRTTRSVKLSEAGGRFVEAARRVIAALADAEVMMSGERTDPRGTIIVTAPVRFGTLRVLPHLNRYLRMHPRVQARLLLLDRVANLIDEGIDVAIRIGHLPETNLIALPVGNVRRVLCASPAYLDRRGTPRDPSELQAHDCIAFTQVTPGEAWTFAAGRGVKGMRHVRVRPRLSTNTAEAAIRSSMDGHGITCVMSYQVEPEVAAGRLKILLPRFEPPSLPVHVIFPEARLAAAKTRSFVDLLVPALRQDLAALGPRA